MIMSKSFDVLLSSWSDSHICHQVETLIPHGPIGGISTVWVR